MQFTGLKDKNGKEIYEGDLLLVDGYNDTYDGCLVEVFFYEAAFKMRNRDFRKNGEIVKRVPDVTKGGYCEWIARGGNKCKVIGNIYENPGLINK
jgi:uncharacterized phage protein (TIGR01671 family)